MKVYIAILLSTEWSGEDNFEIVAVSTLYEKAEEKAKEAFYLCTGSYKKDYEIQEKEVLE